ncbi:MAG: hypothetical protein IKB86_06545 [Clostridia bacterium]|nr:hypothetical protein [Clostridia bacterium]
MKEIRLQISDRNFRLLKKTAGKFSESTVVNMALKQFFDKNHKIKERVKLKKGYRTFGNLNLRLSKILEEDADF